MFVDYVLFPGVEYLDERKVSLVFLGDRLIDILNISKDVQKIITISAKVKTLPRPFLKRWAVILSYQKSVEKAILFFTS